MPRRSPVGPPEDDAELEELEELYRSAVATPDRDALDRLEICGDESARVLRGDEGAVRAGLVSLPMAQYFGGQHVPIAALAGLGVTPTERPKGAATALLEGVLRELRDAGSVAAIAHPQAQAPWRDVGFEQAGTRYLVRVATKHIDVGDRELTIRRIAQEDMGDVVRAYRRHAEPQNGHLVRHPYCWYRIQNPTPGPVLAYLIEGKRGIEGYCYMHQRPRRRGGHELHVTDVASLSRRAGRRLLTLFADHNAMASEVSWHGSPTDGLCVLLPERTFQVTVASYWMARIVDVRGALARRGYPPGVGAELHLWVRDPLIAENTGNLILRVLDGRGSIEPGGRGSVRMDVGGLAALFTGHRTPATLRAAGLLEGPDDELALATTVFGGGDPWHPDEL